MKYANVLINALRLVRSFRPKSLLPYLGVFALLALAIKVNAESPLYQFSGLYQVSDVLPSYCTDCTLELPAEYLGSSLVLAVRTDDKRSLFKALESASRANGWRLERRGKRITATKIEDTGKIFVSCIDTTVQRVPTDEYFFRKRADSLKCVTRDSLRAYADSVRDASPLSVPLGFGRYRLEYIAYNKSFSDKMGVEWRKILSSGNLKRVPTFYDSWQLWATENNDTTFTRRTLEFALDSNLTIDWGNEKQVPEKTYSQDGGVVTTSYEWRKYGISIQIKRTDSRITLDYVVRNEDNGTLNGRAVGTPGDTLTLNGNYRTQDDISEGLPLLSRLPVVGALFSVRQTLTDYKHFEIFLLPIQ